MAVSTTDLLDPELKDFFLVKSSLTDTSIKSYIYLLNRFDSFLSAKGLRSTDVTSIHLSEFFNQFKERSTNTKKTYKNYLNSFFKWLLEENKLPQGNPVRNLKFHGAARRKKLPVVRGSDFSDILRRCQGLREAAIISTLYYTGMRAVEICNLKIEDLNLDYNTYYASLSKSVTGNRPIPIHPNVRVLITEYYKKRVSQDLDHDFLFHNTRGKPLVYRTFLNMIHRILPEGVKHGTHAFRRGFITKVYNETGDIKLAQQLAGHSGIETTNRYIENDPERLKKFTGIDM